MVVGFRGIGHGWTILISFDPDGVRGSSGHSIDEDVLVPIQGIELHSAVGQSGSCSRIRGRIKSLQKRSRRITKDILIPIKSVNYSNKEDEIGTEQRHRSDYKDNRNQRLEHNPDSKG